MPKFDIEEEAIRKLAEILDETDLTEIEIASGDQTIRVARTSQVIAGGAPAIAAPASPSSPEGSAGAPAAEASPGDAVTAPMVGVVYMSPEPGTPAFVKVGDTVSEGDTVLLIEAMKTFNPVRAPRSGTIAKILVADKTPVEFGEELMIIE